MSYGILQRCTAGLASAAVLASIGFIALPAQAASAVSTPIGTSASVSNNAPDPALVAQKDYIIAFDQLLNAERATKGLPPLKFNATVASDAIKWSESMTTDSVGYRHKTTSESSSEFLAAWRTARGENIMASSGTAVSASRHFEVWKNSPGHYANMMNESYAVHGVGFAIGGKHGHYGTNIFRSSNGGVMPHTYASAEAYFSGQPALETTSVIAAAPTFDLDKRTYTIPSSTGVQYWVNGVIIPAGTHQLPKQGYITVFAQVAPGYYLVPTGNIWSRSYVAEEDPMVTPKEPTYDMAGRTYTIPSTTGVVYEINGKRVAAGVYKVSDAEQHVDIIARAVEGYVLTGNTAWFSTYPARISTITVAATVPTFNTTARNYTIPTKAGVSYKVNGASKASGSYSVGDAAATIKITAHANSGYTLSGTSSWSQTFAAKPKPATAVSATVPTFNTTARSYTIPAKTGVNYKVNGAAKTAGTYTVGTAATTVKITAHANAGYALSGTSSWSKAYAAKPKPATSVAASAPTFNTTARSYTIPKKTGVSYKVNGTAKASGTYKLGTAKTTLKVTAHAASGYKLTGTSSWTKTYAAKPLIAVKSTAPSFNTTARSYTIPKKTGVSYKVNGATKAAGTYKLGTAKTTIKVTAHAASGYKLSGTAAWTKTYAAQKIVTVKASAPSLKTTTRTYVIPKKAGVNYKVNGATKKAGTHKVSNAKQTIKVTAHAAFGYKLSGTSSWSKVYPKK